MNLHDRYHTWSHITAVLSIATMSVASQDALPLALSLPVIVWSWIRFRKRLDAAVPQLVVNALLLAALALFALDLTSHGIDQVISAVGRFVVALTLIKLIEKRTARDQGQLLTLSMMMAIGAALTSVTFETGLMFMLYAPTAVWTLVLYQLWCGGVAAAAERGAAIRKERDKRVAPRRVPMSRSLVRGMRRLTYVATAGILAITVAVFIVMPRQLGEGILGSWEEPKSFESGFSDHVQLGAAGTITEGSNVVLETEVIVNAKTGLAASGEQRFLLRGAVLDEYVPAQGMWDRSINVQGYLQGVRSDGTTLVPRRRRGPAIPKDPLRERSATRRLPVMELRVWLRNHNASQLLTLFRPSEFAMSNRVGVLMSRVDGASILTENAGKMEYTVKCDPGVLAERFWQYQPAAWTEPQMNFFFSSPIRDLSLEILAARGIVAPDIDDIRVQVETARAVRTANIGIRDGTVYEHPRPAWPEPPENARRIVEAVQAYLQLNCSYTLDMTPPTGEEDPMEMFLFRTKEGHCEYFASAMTAMCRSVGLESRLVTGYAATEYDVSTGRYIVRESHAHAWVEVHVEPGVWATYDPSPQEQLAAIHHPNVGLIAFVRRTIDRLEGLWASRIVSFNQGTQTNMLEATEASDGPFGFFKWVRARVSSARDKPQPSSAGAYVLRVAVNFVAIMALLFSFGLLLRGGIMTVRSRWGKNGGSRSRRRTIDVPVFYSKMMAVLTRAGLGKPEHIPAGQHADFVAREAPDAGGVVNGLTILYYETRFGGRVLTAEEDRWARSQLDVLRHTLRDRSRNRSEKR